MVTMAAFLVCSFRTTGNSSLMRMKPLPWLFLAWKIKLHFCVVCVIFHVCGLNGVLAHSRWLGCGFLPSVFRFLVVSTGFLCVFRLARFLDHIFFLGTAPDGLRPSCNACVPVSGICALLCVCHQIALGSRRLAFVRMSLFQLHRARQIVCSFFSFALRPARSWLGRPVRALEPLTDFLVQRF